MLGAGVPFGASEARGDATPVDKDEQRATETVSPTGSGDEAREHPGSTSIRTHSAKRSGRARGSRDSYAVYIYRVLKQVHPDVGISQKSMIIMDSFIREIFDRIATEAGKLARYNKRSAITSREIQTAVRLIFPGT